MKKIIYLFFFVLLPSAIHAWIVKTGASTGAISTKSASAAKMRSVSGANFTSGPKSAATPMWAGGDINVADATRYVYRFYNVNPSASSATSPSGFFVGEVLNSNGKRQPHRLSIGITSREYRRVITRVIIKFVALSKDVNVHPTIKKHLGRTTYSTEEKNGDIYGQAIIEPYLPVSVVPIECDAEKVYTDNPFYSDYTKAAGGCLISDISVEYVESEIWQLANHETDYHTTLGKEAKALGQNGTYIQQRGFLMERKNRVLSHHYANTAVSDVNADGNVNSSDVISVYNAILSDEGEVNGIRYVDLGLPSGNLWATMNYGATVPEDFGDLYAYNSTQGFLSHNYYSFTQENYSASAKWDAPSPWRTPTIDDANELFDNCTATTTLIEDEMYCVLLTSKINGNQLVLPAYAYRVAPGVSKLDDQSSGYWTSTEGPINELHKVFSFANANDEGRFKISTNSYMSIYSGGYLRLVCNKGESN